jgi:hypothetical protein
MQTAKYRKFHNIKHKFKQVKIKIKVPLLTPPSLFLFSSRLVMVLHMCNRMAVVHLHRMLHQTQKQTMTKCLRQRKWAHNLSNHFDRINVSSKFCTKHIVISSQGSIHNGSLLHSRLNTQLLIAVHSSSKNLAPV